MKQEAPANYLECFCTCECECEYVCVLIEGMQSVASLYLWKGLRKDSRLTSFRKFVTDQRKACAMML